VLVTLKDTTANVLLYTIKNPVPSVDAEVAAGSDSLFLQRSRDTDFTVNVKGGLLRGLTVCQSTLADANTGDRLGGQYLRLYLEPSEAAANPDARNPYLTLSAPSTKVHLLISSDFRENGVFSGNVALCSANKVPVTTMKLTVNSSSRSARITGAVLIVIGIGLYVLVTVILKQRSRQLTALLPASRLADALTELRHSTTLASHRAGVKLPAMLGDKTAPHSLQWLIAQLSVAKLKNEGFLPPLLTSPFVPPDAGSDYQNYLQGISAQEVNDAIIVRDGFQRVMSLWTQLDEASARVALTQLDQLALEAGSADPIGPKVEALVNGIAPRSQQFTETLANAHDSFRSGGGSPPTVHEISVQLEYVSGVGWMIWALLTFLFGCGVLILSNHGFGTWQDLLKCFLWGIGIQAAGQGLQALTPSSTATTFSLQVGH
jgi:hypothetical protein